MNIIQPTSIERMISIVEAFQKQWDILSGEITNNKEEGSLKDCITKDILMLKNNFIKGMSKLNKRNNPFTCMKHTKSDYMIMFKHFDKLKIRKVEIKVTKIN